MKYSTLTVLIAAFLLLFTSNLFAGDDDWETPYREALELGKSVQLPDKVDDLEGLAYTPPENVILENAITEALGNEAPECEAIKIAIDFDYNPYSVIKSVYSAGGQISLDQLCTCATAAGVMKEIVANAAKDAVSPLNDTIFEMDEIAQAKCLGGEEILAYTKKSAPLTKIWVKQQVKIDFTVFR